MRDPKRIDDILHELRRVWTQHPDWRLTQLLVNLSIVPNTPGYWYYWEDDDILKALREGSLEKWGA